MLAGEVSEALQTYSLRLSGEVERTRRAIVTVGTASLVALSAWLVALSLDQRGGTDLHLAQVRNVAPSPQVTLHPLPVEAAVWRSDPELPALIPVTPMGTDL